MDVSLANSGRQRRTGRPGVLQFMGLQRVLTQLSHWTTLAVSPGSATACIKMDCPSIQQKMYNFQVVLTPVTTQSLTYLAISQHRALLRSMDSPYTYVLGFDHAPVYLPCRHRRKLTHEAAVLKYMPKVHWRHMISSVQVLRQVRLFATPWTAACQASLSITKTYGIWIEKPSGCESYIF